MDFERLNEAEKEAQRFLSRVKDLKAAIATGDKYWSITGSPETSAVKRSSMDLTRSLAKLRARP